MSAPFVRVVKRSDGKGGLKVRSVGAMRDRMIEKNLNIVEGWIEEASSKIVRRYQRDQESHVRILRTENGLTSRANFSGSVEALHCNRLCTSHSPGP